MKNRSPIALVSLAATLLAANGPGAYAGTDPHPISRSVWLQISPEGQKLFEQDFLSVIEGSGFVIRERTIPKINYVADQPVTLNALPDGTTPEQKSALTRIRDEIKRWLLGFELNDPRFAADITDLSYAADFQKVSLRIVGRGSQPDSIRARLDVVLSQLRIHASEVVGRDLNNDWLGEFGIRDASAQMGGNGLVPMTLSGDFEIQLHPDSRLRLKLISLETNLTETPVQLELSREILLPVVEVFINGRKMKLNPEPVSELIYQQKQRLAGALQTYVDSLLREQIPTWFNDASKVLSMKTVDQALPIPAPGAPEGLPEALRQFQLGFYPERIGLTGEGALRIAGGSFVEDKLAGMDAGILPPPAVIPPPIFDRKDHYDFAIGVHPALVNRMLSLSQNRGYFKNIKLSDGSTIELFDAPTFRVGPEVPAGMMKMRLALKTASGGGMKRLFVAKDVKLKFDAYAKVIRNPDASFSLVMRYVDLNSLEVDASSATMGIFKGLVKSKVLEQLTAFDSDLRTKPLMLAAQVRLPESLIGLRWKLVGMTTEPRTGYITAYFGFEH
jgi:hypothetical protein